MISLAMSIKQVYQQQQFVSGGIKYEVQTILGNDGARWGDGGAVSAPINLASERNRKTFLIQLFRTF